MGGAEKIQRVSLGPQTHSLVVEKDKITNQWYAGWMGARNKEPAEGFRNTDSKAASQKL